MHDDARRSRSGIDANLIGRVKSGLGIPQDLTADLDGLRLVYAAWCEAMTFDNIRKLISLRSGDERLAGADASDYFENWLVNRSGGTCWPSSNALFTLVEECGFNARRVAGSMFNVPPINHGSVKVRIDGDDWLIDSSMLTGEPLPLSDELYIKTTGPVRSEVEPLDDGTYFVWTDFPPLNEFIPCRLSEDPVDLSFYHDRYEFSREMSPFNERLYLRTITADGLAVFLGNTLFRRRGEDLEVTPLNGEQLCAAMHEIGGVSESMISRWADAGGLDATMNYSADAPPLPDTGPRPSRR